MSQFKFINEMKSLTIVDSPLTKGPVPRWQRKTQENAANTTANTTANTSKRTPAKRTPGKPHTPAARSRPTTPAADRFIPVRSASHFDLAHHRLGAASPAGEAQRAMGAQLAGDAGRRVLSYRAKPPSAPEGFQNPMRVIYSQARTPAVARSSARYISQAPDRILDAPDIVDDYYLNLMDWSAGNMLAAALGANVYLWNAGTGEIEQLLELPTNDYVCSLSWSADGEHLAVGTTAGTTELWDCSRRKRLRTMDGHSARVGAHAWNSFVLTSGSRTGRIVHHDVRARTHAVCTLEAHAQEVCGLRWALDGRLLASGGNDNVLNVWAAAAGAHWTGAAPLYAFTAHQAAVKALAWCPWQAGVLASGGGTADRCIRFWNCATGAAIQSVDTKSQVCALLWSTNYKELISGHGFANNELIIWKYPSMTKVTELTGHTARVLHLAMSPDGSTVLSAGADETLRLWKCFVKEEKSKTKSGVAVREKPSALKACLR